MAANENSFSISHEFDVPVEKVFEAWTNVEHLKNWFSPKGYSTIFVDADIKPGGMSHYCLASKSGMEMWNKIFYKEIKTPLKLVFTQCFSNKQGNIEPHPMIKNWPVEVQSTVELDEKDGKTTLKLTWEPVNASMEELTKFTDGYFELAQEWGGVFDKLADYLSEKK